MLRNLTIVKRLLAMFLSFWAVLALGLIMAVPFGWKVIFAAFGVALLLLLVQIVLAISYLRRRDREKRAVMERANANRRYESDIPTGASAADTVDGDVVREGTTSRRPRHQS